MSTMRYKVMMWQCGLFLALSGPALAVVGDPALPAISGDARAANRCLKHADLDQKLLHDLMDIFHGYNATPKDIGEIREYSDPNLAITSCLEGVCATDIGLDNYLKRFHSDASPFKQTKVKMDNLEQDFCIKDLTKLDAQHAVITVEYPSVVEIPERGSMTFRTRQNMHFRLDTTKKAPVWLWTYGFAGVTQ